MPVVGLSASESRYPAHKLEFLALKWSVTEKFHDYLYGSSFTVITDNNPLTYILTSAKLDAASHRWLAALSTYNFNLQYRAGNHNQDADAPSRRPHQSTDANCPEELDLVNQFTNDHLDPSRNIVRSKGCGSNLPQLLRASGNPSCVTLVKSLSMSATAISDQYASETNQGLPVVPQLSHLDLQGKQRADPLLREVIHQLQTGERVSPTVRTVLPDIAILLRDCNRLELHDDVLYRRRQDKGTCVISACAARGTMPICSYQPP